MTLGYLTDGPLPYVVIANRRVIARCEREADALRIVAAHECEANQEPSARPAKQAGMAPSSSMAISEKQAAFREYRVAHADLCMEECYRHWHLLFGHDESTAAYVARFGIVCGCTRN